MFITVKRRVFRWNINGITIFIFKIYTVEQR